MGQHNLMWVRSIVNSRFFVFYDSRWICLLSIDSMVIYLPMANENPITISRTTTKTITNSAKWKCAPPHRCETYACVLWWIHRDAFKQSGETTIFGIEDCGCTTSHTSMLSRHKHQKYAFWIFVRLKMRQWIRIRGSGVSSWTVVHIETREALKSVTRERFWRTHEHTDTCNATECA